MGLKESGLRGSLRSTSSVLPAFFDVTITNTNSPVQEGDILTVDYSADNTGDAQDTQDIRLEIDSVEEDRDSDITLLGAQSTTGTLEWDTTDEDETTYTATVLSDDDTDSVTVEIESAIPDSGLLHNWDVQALTGFNDSDTVNTIPDSHGSNDFTSGSATYDAEGINGNPAINFGGATSYDSQSQISEAADGQYSVHLVIQSTVDNSDYGVFEESKDNEGTKYETRSLERTVTHGGIFDGNNGSITTNVEVISFRWGDSFGTTPDFEVNGSKEALDAGGDKNNINNVARLGESGAGGNFTGLFGQALYYDEEQSDSDFNDTISALQNRWGI